MKLNLSREDLKLDCNSRSWNEVTYADFRSNVQTLILLAGKARFYGNTESDDSIFDQSRSFMVFPPFYHNTPNVDYSKLKLPKIHYVLTIESVESASKNYITAKIEISTSEKELDSINLLPLDLLEEDYFVAIKALLKNWKTLRTDLSTQQRGFIDYLRSSRGLDFYTNSCSLAMRVV